jgi:biotin transport system substrate-specific component
MSSILSNAGLVTLEPVAGNSLVKKALLVVGGSLFLAALSQVAIGYPVPTTLQTLGVLLIGLTFGFRMAAATLALYLLEGAAGLPVFAKFSSGYATLIGPTGGYLFGFLLAAAAIGYLADKGFTRSWPGTVIALLIGEAILFALGVFWLGQSLGMSLPDAMAAGFTPFIGVDAVKTALAALIGKGVLKGAARFTSL